MEPTKWEDIIVIVRGGLVSCVLTRIPEAVSITLVDYDNKADEPELCAQYEKDIEALEASGEFRAIL